MAQSNDSTVTKTFNVSGNCGGCKKAIEKPFKKLDGVEKASWDKDTKVFTITYKSSALTPEDIKKKIAATGYDVEDVKGSDEAYSKLPSCCKYREHSHE